MPWGVGITSRRPLLEGGWPAAAGGPIIMSAAHQAARHLVEQHARGTPPLRQRCATSFARRAAVQELARMKGGPLRPALAAPFLCHCSCTH